MFALLSIAAHEKQAGIGIGCPAPMGSDVFVYVFQPVPGQDFLGSTANELRVLVRHGVALDGRGHAGKGLPEVAAVKTRCTQCWHGCIQAFKVKAQLGCIHALEYRQRCRTACECVTANANATQAAPPMECIASVPKQPR